MNKSDGKVVSSGSLPTSTFTFHSGLVSQNSFDKSSKDECIWYSVKIVKIKPTENQVKLDQSAETNSVGVLNPE